MSDKTLMVSVSGIRGIVGEGFTPEVIMRFVAAYRELIGPGTFVVGRDTRSSGPMVLDLLKGTLQASGANVIDLGVCPTPTVALLVRELGAHGGIIITASHNPNSWNALKLLNGQGLFLDAKEGQKLKELYDAGEFSWAAAEALGSVSSKEDAAQIHAQKVLDLINVPLVQERNFKVLIDSVNGAGSTITPWFLKQLGCEVIELNCDPHKDFPRDPEPLEKNLGATIAFAQQQNIDVGFIQDPDADRLAILSEKGRFIGEEYSLILAAMEVLEHEQGPLVVNMSSSQMIDALASKYGLEAVRSPVGEIHVSLQMKKLGSVIGGEGNGGVIWPKLHYGRDSLAGIALVLSLMARTGLSIEQLTSSVPHYKMRKEKMPLKDAQFFDKAKQASQDFQEGTVDSRDGFKFVWPDRWVHVRASNTEPVVRVIAEGQSDEQLDELFQFVQSMIG